MPRLLWFTLFLLSYNRWVPDPREGLRTSHVLWEQPWPFGSGFPTELRKGKSGRWATRDPLLHPHQAFQSAQDDEGRQKRRKDHHSVSHRKLEGNSKTAPRAGCPQEGKPSAGLLGWWPAKADLSLGGKAGTWAEKKGRKRDFETSSRPAFSLRCVGCQGQLSSLNRVQCGSWAMLPPLFLRGLAGFGNGKLFHQGSCTWSKSCRAV